MRRHQLLGLFALLTLGSAALALERILHLSTGDGLYVAMLGAAAIAWWIGRRQLRRPESR